jgi:uncharacterized protein (DUF433 family)
MTSLGSNLRQSPSPDDLRGDLIQPSHPLFGIVWVNRERMSGTPCFTGTRVPIKNLFDYLEAGDSLDNFLEGFPGVSREQAIAVIDLAARGFLDTLGVK